MLYPDLIKTLAAEIPTQLSDSTGLSAAPFIDPNYNVELPRFIEWAELKMQRDPDLDFLAMRTSFATVNTAPGVSLVALPQTMIVPLEIGYYTPAGSTATSGTFVPLAPASRDFIRFAYSGAANAPPAYYARADDNSITTAGQGMMLLGPAPDAAYALSFYGTARFTPMSSTNQETFIGDFLPDLFWAAVMERVSAYQRNFVSLQASDGSQSQLTSSWAVLYNECKKSVAVEQARQKAQSSGWQVQAPTPVATPPRS